MPEKCTETCPLVPRVEALERANEEHGRFHDKLNERIGKVETENAVQNEHAKGIVEKLDKILDWQEEQRDRLPKIDEIAEVSQRLATLEAKPGKRWDGVVTSILTAVGPTFILWVALGMPGVGG